MEKSKISYPLQNYNQFCALVNVLRKGKQNTDDGNIGSVFSQYSNARFAASLCLHIPYQ